MYILLCHSLVRISTPFRTAPLVLCANIAFVAFACAFPPSVEPAWSLRKNPLVEFRATLNVNRCRAPVSCFPRTHSSLCSSLSASRLLNQPVVAQIGFQASWSLAGRTLGAAVLSSTRTLS